MWADAQLKDKSNTDSLFKHSFYQASLICI